MVQNVFEKYSENPKFAGFPNYKPCKIPDIQRAKFHLRVVYTGVPRKIVLFSVKSLKSRQLFKQHFMIFLRVERH